MSHAILSPSGAEKWLNCPASIALECTLPEDDKGSDYAREGTLAHALAEECLRNDLDPVEFIDKALRADDVEGVVTYDMADAVEKYLIYVRNLGEYRLIEQKVDFSAFVPEGSGYSDCLIERVDNIEGKDVNTLYVIDYKHGKGVEVRAEENKQGMLYGVGALLTLDHIFQAPIERVVIAIIQPRINNFSEWAIATEDLLRWVSKEVAPKAELAYGLYKEPGTINESHIVPSEKGCRWCRFKSNCKKFAQKGYETALEDFEDLTKPVEGSDFKTVAKLGSELLAKCYEDMSLFITWYDSLKSEILDRLLRGEKIPGLKVVEGRSSRKWNGDAEKIIKALRTAGLKKEDYEVISLISPSQAEKVLREVKKVDFKKRFKKLTTNAIYKAPGAPTIAKESDKRQDIAPIASDFEDVSKNVDDLI